jgi:hypothetical protein
MNRFDEAVLELLSSAPRATSVDALRVRSKRRRRRRAATVVAIAAAISVGSVGVAASLGHDGGGPHVEVSPTTSTPTPVDRTWCVAFSHDQAVARGLAYGSIIVDAPSTRAKLVSLAELLRDKNNPLVTTDPQTHLTEHKKFWVVELRPTAKTQGPYKWALVAVDANTGAVVTGSEGPSSGGGGPTEPAIEPPYFEALPDHGAACPSGSPTTSTTTVAQSLPSPGTHESDPRVDLAVHQSASDLGDGASIDSRVEAVKMHATGPEGTVISLWTYWPNATSGCIGVVDSAAGPGDTPGLGINCGRASFNNDALQTAPTATPGKSILAGAGYSWAAPSRHDYWLMWERDLPDVRHVTLVFADGTQQKQTVVDGFWIAYLTPYQANDYRVIYTDQHGHELGTRADGLHE